jgi:membrane-bound lytic murein transglycosylase B
MRIDRSVHEVPAAGPRGGARRRRAAGVALAAAALWLASPAGAAATRDDFARWLLELRSEAIARGISEGTVESALTGVEPDPRVLELDRAQPGKPSDFCAYMERRLTPTRIERARRMLEEHGGLLEDLHAAYGVPPRYLVAVWGLETNFGDYPGDFPVIPALATLAHDERRGEVFREQVFAALRIVDEGHLSAESFRGSWAGASGHVQFMPTTFLSYAVDYDGDGRKDIWTSVPDSLASAAHYMRAVGWRPGEGWGRRVLLPDGLRDAPPGDALPLAEWSRLGVRRHDGEALPAGELRGSIVLPRRSGDPAFLVYRNYHTFMAWNRSTFFAISLGSLADRVGGRSSSSVCGL